MLIKGSFSVKIVYEEYSKDRNAKFIICRKGITKKSITFNLMYKRRKGNEKDVENHRACATGDIAVPYSVSNCCKNMGCNCY